MRLGRNIVAFGVLVALMGYVLAASAAEPAKVILEVQTDPDGATQVVAKVVDDLGNPIPEVMINFKARMTFGWLQLSEASTDEEGRARISLPSSLRPQEVVAEASGETGTVQAAIKLREAHVFEPAVRPGRAILRHLSPQPGFISPYPDSVLPLVLGLVLGTIWAIYGYVIWHLVRIRSSP